jgi:hypothetical protein
MEPLTPLHTSLLLALAQCSGWSADRIRLKILEVAGEEIKAEIIWSFHWRWFMGQGNEGEKMCRKDVEAMLCVMKEYGITLPELGRPLHKTEQPVSFVYCQCDYPSFLFIH